VNVNEGVKLVFGGYNAKRMRICPLTAEISRRHWLRASSGAMGLALLELLGLQHAGAVSSGGAAGKAKSCIVLYCWGGMSHLDTWDLKPDAPAEVRGEFPAATRACQLGAAQRFDRSRPLRAGIRDDNSRSHRACARSR
jgi:hypothetical protein